MEPTMIALGATSSSKMSSFLISQSFTSHSTPPYFSSTQLASLQLSRPRPALLLPVLDHCSNRLRFSTRYAAFGGGGFGSIDGGASGGGGDGSPESGDGKLGAAAANGSTLSSDVIILDVRGMSCGGCAAKVKRILESQPQVSSASVYLKTETAIVWPVSEVKATPNWQKDVGEVLAKYLTNCGFKSNLRGLKA